MYTDQDGNIKCIGVLLNWVSLKVKAVCMQISHWKFICCKSLRFGLVSICRIILFAVRATIHAPCIKYANSFLHTNASLIWFGSIIIVLASMVQYWFPGTSTVLEYCIILRAAIVVMVGFWGSSDFNYTWNRPDACSTNRRNQCICPQADMGLVRWKSSSVTSRVFGTIVLNIRLQQLC